jgi:hypothetical protein
MLSNAHTRTAAYVDDNAQGSHTFEELLQGWNDFLDLCVQENWQLNATKTHVGYPSCVFFGFEVDSQGTRLAEKNLDPVRRMVPPSNLHDVRKPFSHIIVKNVMKCHQNVIKYDRTSIREVGSRWFDDI